MQELTGNAQVRKRKGAAYLMLAFMVGWIITMLTIQLSIGFSKGYGTGFGDGGRVPPEIVERAGVGDKAADVVAATSHNTPEDMTVWEDAVRLIFSIAVLVGIYYFWYIVISRIGIF